MFLSVAAEVKSEFELERFGDFPEGCDFIRKYSKSVMFQRIPKSYNMNSDFASTAKNSSQREPIPYICGLRARTECEPLSEHSTRSDRVTNIGYRLSLGASTLPRQIRSS